jgi:hypothetical protein
MSAPGPEDDARDEDASHEPGGRSAEATDASSEPAARVAPRRSRWWVAAITFVAGVVVGVLAVGLLNVGNPPFPGSDEQRATGTSSVPGGGQTVAVTAQAEVNAACLRVINAAQDVYSILTGVDEAASDLDLQQLDDIVRRLEPVEPRLAQGLRDCRVQTAIAGQQPTSPPSRPLTTSPTATATR